MLLTFLYWLSLYIGCVVTTTQVGHFGPLGRLARPVVALEHTGDNAVAKTTLLVLALVELKKLQIAR